MDICFIQTAAPGESGSMHPIHRKMAISVGADFQTVYRRDLPGPLNGSVFSDLFFLTDDLDPGYDIFVFESPSTLYLLPNLSDEILDSKLIYLHTNVRPFGSAMYPMINYNLVLKYLGKVNQSVDAKILRWLCNIYLDGIITVSDLFLENSTWYSGEISVATPFIRNELLDQLEQVTPDHSKEKVVYLGHDRGHKGIDILVEAWPLVRRSHPNAELKLYGSNHSALLNH
ncbi:hypothetical protein SAMN05216388_10776 [Halorientalis persicus]|uniref:Uncharacterized protein n=1 Tax=Halorientalis persicus TaxID=1367881 RepID=A0A1H8WTZ2_9EURY|nr:glycosyltransferase [Halorientalis persicus]SEP31154.1 hypothetical protein SAMN05216388_10776 [Halorientalis persicus]